MDEFRQFHGTGLRHRKFYCSHPQLLPGYHDEPHHCKILWNTINADAHRDISDVDLQFDLHNNGALKSIDLTSRDYIARADNARRDNTAPDKTVVSEH